MNNDAIGIAKQLQLTLLSSSQCVKCWIWRNGSWFAPLFRHFRCTNAWMVVASDDATIEIIFHSIFFSMARHSHVVHFTKHHRPPIATHSHVEGIRENPNYMINGHIHLVVFATPLSLFIDVTVIAHTDRSELRLYAKHMSLHTCNEMSSHSRQQQADWHTRTHMCSNV